MKNTTLHISQHSFAPNPTFSHHDLNLRQATRKSHKNTQGHLKKTKLFKSSGRDCGLCLKEMWFKKSITFEICHPYPFRFFFYFSLNKFTDQTWNPDFEHTSRSLKPGFWPKKTFKIAYITDVKCIQLLCKFEQIFPQKTQNIYFFDYDHYMAPLISK